MTTIYDVAKTAGVTATTVSNALAGKGSVGPETRAKVMHHAQKLNYMPNLVARSLIKGHTGVIGLVLPALDNPFFAAMATALERIAYQAGLCIFVSTFSEGEQIGQQMLKDLALRRVDGILIFDAALAPEAIHTLSLPGVPLIYCLSEETSKNFFPLFHATFSGVVNWPPNISYH